MMQFHGLITLSRKTNAQVSATMIDGEFVHNYNNCLWCQEHNAMIIRVCLTTIMKKTQEDVTFCGHCKRSVAKCNNYVVVNKICLYQVNDNVLTSSFKLCFNLFK